MAAFPLRWLLVASVGCSSAQPTPSGAPPPPAECASRLGCRRTGVEAAVPPPWPLARPARVETDWCIDGVDTLDEETCVVVPGAPARELLVYFHGIVPPSRDSLQKTNYQSVVAAAARRANVVAMMPRGRKAFAPAANPGWWAWPTTSAAYQAHARELIDSISRKQRTLEALLGVSFTEVYAAGSSSGAYFVALLALHDGFDVKGFAAISGGAGTRSAELELGRLRPRPFYVGFGTHDTVGASARALGDLLRDAGWPVRVAEHPVGHGAREIYLDEAFEFFRASNGR